MGAKFANMQVKGAHPDEVAPLCPGCTVRELAPGWVTVVSEDFGWGNMQKEAKRLSKLLPAPVLSVEYFDDDYVELAVYRDGKRTARHVPAGYEDIPRKAGRPKQFLEALELPEGDLPLLRLLLKSTSAEQTVTLFESLLGCVLWADPIMVASPARPAPRRFLEEYDARETAVQKIKNQTALTLLSETEGGFIPFDGPVFTTIEDSARVFWTAEEDGRPRRMFELPPTGYIEAPCGQYDGQVYYFTCAEFPKDEAAAWDGQSSNYVLYLVSNSGALLNTFDLTTAYEHVHPVLSFLDRGHFFYSGSCYSAPVCKRVWALPLGASAQSVGPAVPFASGTFAVAYKDRGEDDKTHTCLQTFRRDGASPGVCSFPGFASWEAPLAWSGRLLFCYCGYDGRSYLVCLDGGLSEQWRIVLPNDGFPVFVRSYSPALDPDTDMLYVQTGVRQMASVSLPDQKIVAVRDFNADEAYVSLAAALPGTGPVLERGRSKIEVLDRTLETISIHRVRGGPDRCLPHREGLLVLACTPEKYKVVQRDDGDIDFITTKPGRLRSYLLKRRA